MDATQHAHVRADCDLTEFSGSTQPACNFDALFLFVLISARYVEVDYVRAAIITPDICVINGIIHTVDTILGLPAKTIYTEISSFPKYT